LHERGELLGLRIPVPIRILSAAIGRRMLDAALAKLPGSPLPRNPARPARGAACAVMWKPLSST
jgi:hypothetical protein